MQNQQNRSRSRSPTYHIIKAMNDLKIAPESTPETANRDWGVWWNPTRWHGWVEKTPEEIQQWKQHSQWAGWQNFDNKDKEEKNSWFGWKNFNQNDEKASSSASRNTKKWEWINNRWWMMDAGEWYTKWSWNNNTWTWFSTEEWAVLENSRAEI